MPPAQGLHKSWVVFFSTFPPRECGIATFTQDLTNAFDSQYYPKEESKIVAINNNNNKFIYPKKVIDEIDQQKREDYSEVAKRLNALHQVRLVNLQHEFGIFGGEYGNYIIDFLKEIKKPVVVTFHTVLPGPNPILHKTVIELASYVKRIIVMTRTSKEILVRDYAIDSEKIAIIPHGIHPQPYTDHGKSKTALKLKRNLVVSTFGLLSRGKGIEYAIDAMPEVVKRFPSVKYLVIGATHPDVLKKEGEAYRNELTERVKNLGLEKNVVFYNQYLSTDELLGFLEATDVYVALPLDPNQAVSGTLSYALGAGRPVVSTSFAQAREDVTPDVGVLVDFRNSDQVRDALITLLDDKKKREEMGKNAYFRTRKMEWRNVVLSYMREYISLVHSLGMSEKNLPKMKIRHIIKLTDNFGMIQFAKLTEPDITYGYTLDDNARAMLAMSIYYSKFKSPIALSLVETYLGFIEHCSIEGDGFTNYVAGDKSHTPQNQKEDLEDANARCFNALSAVASNASLPKEVKERAKSIFKKHIKIKDKSIPAKSLALYIKAFSRWLTVEKNNKEIEDALRGYCDELVERFRRTSAPNWQWFEDTMTYSNGLLPDALFTGYSRFKDHRYFDVAKAATDFLVSYSFQDEMCVPIGQNGWFRRGGRKQLHDQQPEEVMALILCLKSIHNLTAEEEYHKRMYQAFNWFLGNNTLGQVVYDQSTGGCYDGVGENYVNLNQGAESTLVYFIARLALG